MMAFECSPWVGVMGLCFSYAVLDVSLMQSRDCMQPMQSWFLISCANALVFACLQLAGQNCSDLGKNFIFYFRQRTWLSQCVIFLNWLVFLPFFTLWTVLGSLRLRETVYFSGARTCTALGSTSWLVLFWQVLCYVCICVYAAYFGIACFVEYRHRVAEKNMRSVESSDSLARWGPLPDPRSLDIREALEKTQKGLQPSEIKALPSPEVYTEGTLEDPTCSICLAEFDDGDRLRRLPHCGHYFHAGCVDLWLLRRSDCPLCKDDVSK